MCRPTARLCEEGWALCPPPSSSPSQQQSLGCCPSGAECVDPSKSNNSGNGDDNLPEEEEGYTLNSGLCRVPKSYRTCAIPGWKECNIKGLEGVCCPREGGWRCALEAKDGTGCVLGNETATGPKTTTTTKITGGSQGILPTPIDTRGAIPTSGGGRARGGGWRSLEVVVVVIGLSIVFAVGGGRIW
ncbi:hypothetical protein DFH27DRAFT_578610 [Peziza echinospora]|nr:hypothetical protein DFH27DRAFT_578610 [Peziza echinospora]